MTPRYLLLSKKITTMTVIMAFVLLLPAYASAQAGLPFGGIIIKPIFCPCSANVALRIVPIGATSPHIVMFQPGVSTLYAFWNILKPGTYLLGTYGPPVPCLSIVFCIPDPRVIAAPIIIMTGTSQ